MMMTLNDLKDGMVVVLRNGDPYIVLRNVFYYGDILAGYKNILEFYNTQISLTRYNADMTFKSKSIDPFDIMEIYEKPEDIFHAFFKKGKLIWEREKHKEVTMQELEEKFGCKVKIVGNEEEHNDVWIPCSERLPENDNDVLCWYEYRIMQGTHEGEMNQKFEIGYYNKYFKRWGGEVSSGRDCKVIAWRPLPEPYKEDEEE
jgi:hypothetical protein